MMKIDPEELQDILRHLEQAIRYHMEWFDALNRALVCRLPYNLADVDPQAHMLCDFGRWYYGPINLHLQEYPAFAAIENEHRLMHDLLRKLLQSMSKNQTVNSADYDAFAAALAQLRLQIDTLKAELQDSLHNLDPLTGANTRIGMLTYLREQHELVKRHVHCYSLAMMDIDHFKAVNDRCGHVIGDVVLKATAGYVLAHCRPYDKVFRYGGEEFLMGMPNTDLNTAYQVLERLRTGIAELTTNCEVDNVVQVTVSFGVTLLDPDVFVEESIKRADRAMYAAKRTGRNRTLKWEYSMGDSTES